MKYSLTRKELKNKGAFQYKEGDVIEVDGGRYYIWIKYGNYSRPSMLTIVEPKDSFNPLPMYKHPQYIRDFINKLPEELNN